MLKARFGRIILVLERRGPVRFGRSGQLRGLQVGGLAVARSLTRELGGRGITANVVASGFIDTDMTAEPPEATQQQYLASILAGRFASPAEVAKVIVWLAGDDAAYISGAVIPVDGGLGMGH